MRTKLLFTLVCTLIAGYLFAQPEPVASFPFDEDFLDAKEMIASQAEGNVVIGDDAVRGKVALFPGVDTMDRVTLDATAIYDFDAVTYNIWFRTTETRRWSRVITLATAEPDGVYPELFITPNNGRFADSLTFTVDAGNGNAGTINDDGVEMCADEATVLDKWYMVTATQNATNMKFYVNGVLVADSIHKAGAPSTLEMRVAWLGKAGWPDPMFYGAMDNLKVFDKVLTDEEVTALYNAESGQVGINPVNVSLNLFVKSTNNTIRVINPDNHTISGVQVYNLAGGLVVDTKDFNGVIYHNLPSSMYIVKIQSNKGEFNTKIVVE